MKRALHPFLAVGCAWPGACSSADREAEQAAPPASLAGGWQDSNIADPSVKATAAYAASRIGGVAQLKALESASQQVVSGMNYRLNLTLDDGGKWTATVWRKLDGSMELTASEKVAPLASANMKLDPVGLRVFAEDGTAHFIPFGATHKEVMKAIAFRGPAEESTNPDCGAGPVQFASWPDGLDLLFQDGVFGGWSLHAHARDIKLLDGTGIGSSLADLRKAGPVVVEDTTLGNEFLVDGVSGILDGKTPTSRVTNLWAGLSCVFR